MVSNRGERRLEKKQRLAHVVGHYAHRALGSGVDLGFGCAVDVCPVGMHNERRDRGDEILQVVGETARHEGEVLHFGLESGFGRQARVREDVVDQLTDCLQTLHFRIGKRSLLLFGSDGDEEGRGGGAVRDGNDGTQGIFAEEKGEVIERR